MSSVAEVVLTEWRGLCSVTSSHLCWSAGGRQRRGLCIRSEGVCLGREGVIILSGPFVSMASGAMTMSFVLRSSLTWRGDGRNVVQQLCWRGSSTL